MNWHVIWYGTRNFREEKPHPEQNVEDESKEEVFEEEYSAEDEHLKNNAKEFWR